MIDYWLKQKQKEENAVLGTAFAAVTDYLISENPGHKEGNKASALETILAS